MGCNYYTKIKECKHCGRYEEIHLGKSSYGWKFSFQYNEGEYYKNIEEMKEWLKDKQIYDECGEKISQKQFWDMVKAKQKEKLAHSEKHPDRWNFMIGEYSFSDGYFS